MTPAPKSRRADPISRTRVRELCTAHKRDGSPCTRRAGAGGVCSAHGGAAPQVRLKSIARTVAGRGLMRGLPDAEPVTDTLGTLQVLVGKLMALRELAEDRLRAITDGGGSIRYTSKFGVEQLRGEADFYERVMTSTAKLLTELARLNLEERILRLEEAKLTLIVEAVSATLAKTGLTPEQRDAAIVDLAARLRGPAKVIAAPAPIRSRLS